MEFFYFFGDGVGMSEIGGGRGVSRSGEVNPSAAGTGTNFDGVSGVDIQTNFQFYLDNYTNRQECTLLLDSTDPLIYKAIVPI